MLLCWLLNRFHSILFYSGQELEYVRIYFSLRFFLLFNRLPSKEKEFQSTGPSEQWQLWRYVPVVRQPQGFSFREALVTSTWLYTIVQFFFNLLDIRISWWAILSRFLLQNFLWCSHSGGHPENNLAKFGYILDMKGGKQTGVFNSNSWPHTLHLDEV
jgi:hypothetical protein